MKLLVIYILLFVSYSHLFADWLSFQNLNLKSTPTVKVLSQRDNVIKLEITLPGIEVFQINQNDEVFQYLKLPGYYTTSEVDKPQVPNVGRQNLSEFLFKILRDTFINYKHYLHIPYLDSDDVSYSLFFV